MTQRQLPPEAEELFRGPILILTGANSQDRGLPPIMRRCAWLTTSRSRTGTEFEYLSRYSSSLKGSPQYLNLVEICRMQAEWWILVDNQASALRNISSEQVKRKMVVFDQSPREMYAFEVQPAIRRKSSEQLEFSPEF
jgi:hypothetical protein